MKIKKIHQKELQSYIDSNEYKQAAHIAISKHRALSHIRNPRVRKDDLVLVLVYQAEEMVAYLGVFADDLHFSTGVEHVGWLSCMWVNPCMRGKGIARQLLQTVFEAWDYKILVTEFTPAAYGLYQKTKQFVDLTKPQGIRGYLRLNLAYLLPQKNEKWNKWKPFLRLVDSGFNLWQNLRLKLDKTPCPAFEYLAEIDQESWQLVAQWKAENKELINRDAEDLKWLVRYPWLLSTGLKDRNEERYHFSATAAFFSFLNIKIYNDKQELIAFVILSVRNQNMKVPYAYFVKGAEKEVWQVIYHHLIKMNLDILTVFNSKLVTYLQNNRSPFFKKRAFKRHYIIGKVLEKQLQDTPDFLIQDGDADAAFT